MTIPRQWSAGDLQLIPMDKNSAPLMKALFETNKSVAACDPSFGEHDIAVYQGVIEEMNQKDHFLRTILDADNKPVGFFHMNFHQARERVCWISMMSVNAEYQGQGLGARVYRAIEDQVKESGEADRIWLQVFVGNEAAVMFWVKQGFLTIVKSGQEDENGQKYNYLILEKSLNKSQDAV
ncbi:GNAT family N-acetyltransferase [Parendozoicomonas haliclonae]|uniref:Acetyltransferase (GNAT) family protein n=1 Tax=Parendozoicomonas haliclonae TaxID=1960125 RepID=A0A1X7ARG9_9GAMM|nr:GNAT family N-acetyltransferase [Parendozoicomonas haliclonae]SMA50743.1 Acetyltransferase (GNAT) family protein [Parendozoicomonas haliclonae]